MQGGAALRKRTKQVKVTRVFRDVRAERCGHAGKGIQKAERLAVSEKMVAYLIEVSIRALSRRAFERASQISGLRARLN